MRGPSKTSRRLIFIDADAGAHAPRVADDRTWTIVTNWLGGGESQHTQIVRLYFHVGGMRAAHQDGVHLGQVIARHVHEEVMFKMEVDEIRSNENALHEVCLGGSRVLERII